MINELNTTHGKHEEDWFLNVFVDDAAVAKDIRPALPDHRHGIRSIVITANNDEWIKILSGNNILIGPLNLEKGLSWSLDTGTEFYCTRGEALKIQTERDFGVHCLIKGGTGRPVISTSASSSPSASPSEGA